MVLPLFARYNFFYQRDLIQPPLDHVDPPLTLVYSGKDIKPENEFCHNKLLCTPINERLRHNNEAELRKLISSKVQTGFRIFIFMLLLAPEADPGFESDRSTIANKI